MRIKHMLFTMLILTGCENNTSIAFIEGPELSKGSIQSVTIESLENGTKSDVIKDKDSIKTVENLFSKYRWQKNNNRKFIPSYKFIIITNENIHINYWLGAISDLNEPPCYQLCSGWWVLSSDVKNKMNGNIYKSISVSSQMFELAALLDKVEKQPDKAPQPTQKNGAAEL